MPRSLRDPITYDEMRLAMICGSTFDRYKYDIWRMLEYGLTHDEDVHWLTDHAKTQLMQIQVEIAPLRIGSSERASRQWSWLKKFLLDCEQHPILIIPNVTVRSFMEYLQTRRDNNGNLLKTTAYETKRSPLHHLFRCHPGLQSYPPGFKEEMDLLMGGFTRTVQTRRAHLGEIDDGDGKKPLNPDLYRCLCRWFFELGTAEGHWAHCFLVCTWNLMCRANNTCTVKFSHISWHWDHLVIAFAQTKTDPRGQMEKYPRALYANPVDPLLCPVFALGCYLSTFGTAIDPQGNLFPGNSQYNRFSSMFARMLKDHEQEVLALGYDNLKDLGSHSVRKGATTFISGQPGGPSAMSICIRGGWSLGGVKDVYMTYQAEGDAYCGRMLSMLPIMQSTFASSPPKLETSPDDNTTNNNTTLPLSVAFDTVAHCFPSFDNNGRLGATLQYCLASMAYHKDKVLALPMQHHLRRNVFLFTDAMLLSRVASHAKVKQPWDEPGPDGVPIFGSGIPQTVAVLVCQQQLLDELQQFKNNFEDTLNRVLDERNANAGGISETRMREIVNDIRTGLTDTIRAQLQAEIQRYGLGGPLRQAAPLELNDTPIAGVNNGNAQVMITYHTYTVPGETQAKMRRVPKEWRFPSCPLRQLWIQWNRGDTVNGVPPLRTLETKHVSHVKKLDPAIRAPKKIMGDMRLVCNYIDRIATHNRFDPVGRTVAELAGFFDRVANVQNGLLAGGNRDTQSKWRTHVRKIASIVKERDRHGRSDQ